MNIDLSKLNYQFRFKPLLIGGKAKECYGVRKAGDDIDFVVSEEDYRLLAQKYPNNLKDIEEDLGVAVDEFELWRSISWFDYSFLKEGAKDLGIYLVISLEKLLFLVALKKDEGKYVNDLSLIVKKIIELQYQKGQPR